MDLRNSQTQKWLLVALGAFVAAYFWHAKVYGVYQEKIDGGYTRLEALETELKNVEIQRDVKAYLRDSEGIINQEIQKDAEPGGNRGD